MKHGLDALLGLALVIVWAMVASSASEATVRTPPVAPAPVIGSPTAPLTGSPPAPIIGAPTARAGVAVS